MEVLRDRLYHDDLPAAGRMIGGDDDLLWVSEFRVSLKEEEVWTAYAEDGRIAGTLRVPAYRSLMDIDTSRAIIRYQDDPAAPELKVFRLVWRSLAGR